MKIVKRIAGKKKNAKAVLLGLDCMDPDLVFGCWRSELPTLDRLIRGSTAYGPLRSITPPITIPAWMCMMTSRTPGDMGIYGFRNRADYSYDNLSIVSSQSVKEKTIYDYLGDACRSNVIVGVPPSFPIKPIQGSLISCFMTPNTDEFTYPAELREEVLAVANDYDFDVKGFRENKPDQILEQLYRMTAARFQVLEHLAVSKPWDFFGFVEIGIDRINHAFWHYMDEDHVLYPGPNPYESAILNYYKYVDEKLAVLIDKFDDDTHLLVVSDHGAKRMDGGIAVNEWLIKKGYLALHETPQSIRKLQMSNIDWSRTRAWGEGGYYGRMFINLRGREPQGIVPQNEYKDFRDQLKNEIKAIRGFNNEQLKHIVHYPEDLYPEVRKVAPDLMIFFGNLYWRSLGTVGSGEVLHRENDSGPDGANHDWDGIFIASTVADYRKNKKRKKHIRAASIMDIAPSLMKLYRLTPDKEMRGKAQDFWK